MEHTKNVLDAALEVGGNYQDYAATEMYLTGQGGYLFSKLFINDQFNQVGLISSDMLSMEQVDTYFEYAKEIGITLQTNISP